jgi:hypothetical protein
MEEEMRPSDDCLLIRISSSTATIQQQLVLRDHLHFFMQREEDPNEGTKID